MMGGRAEKTIIYVFLKEAAEEEVNFSMKDWIMSLEGTKAGDFPIFY